MAARSEIEWTTHTWNVTTGCSRVGPECDHCYAMGMAHRFDWGQHLTRRHEVELDLLDGRRRVDIVDWNGTIDIHRDRLDRPLRWREPSKVFVCSTSDLFHPKVHFEYIAAAMGVMAAARRHTFQLLTKRPGREAEFFRWLFEDGAKGAIWQTLYSHARQAGVPEHRIHEEMGSPWPWPLPNVWCGTSVGTQSAKARIDELREVPAVIRFLSIEPLLEDLGELDLRGIGWVIVGGESGPRARPMHADWARSIRDQCAREKIPFFFKQYGRFGPAEQLEGCRGRHHVFGDGTRVVAVGKKKAGRLLDERLHDAMPHVPPLE